MSNVSTISPLKNRIDDLEVALSLLPQDDAPLKHVFVGGIYMRTILMHPGQLIVSKIHRLRHNYILVQGVCSVWINGDWQLLEAPHFGITEPGTRRILKIHSTCIWSTFHRTDILPDDESEGALLKAVDEVERIIIEPNTRVAELKLQEGYI